MSIAMNKVETELPFMIQTDLKGRELFMSWSYVRHNTIYDILHMHARVRAHTHTIITIFGKYNQQITI